MAPSRIGEIAIVNIRGSTKYALRRDAFLAKTDKVTLDLGLNGVKGKDIVSFFFYLFIRYFNLMSKRGNLFGCLIHNSIIIFFL